MRRNLLLISMLFVSSMLLAQQIEIKGVVLEKSSNEPLIGVSVVEKGTINGTLTDIDGRFSLKVPAEAVVLATYIGYQPSEVRATTEEIVIRLSEQQNLLDEVVVVGYGIQKKSVVTAAIASVKGDALGKVMPTRVDNVLKGMVSGVNITQNSGQPGDGSKVRIRGTGTINNSDPLYIVDGMPVGGGIDYLNPADIESVEILKDAASGAIYGSRAANGVILVTTKKGKEGRAVINYNFSYGWQNPWKKRSVLNATQYATLMNEMRINDGNAPLYDDPRSYGKGTDWQDQVFNYDAPVSDHQLSISGATDVFNYYLSLGLFNQEGIIGGNFNRSNYDRKSIRLNTSYIAFDDTKKRDFLSKLTVGTNLAYSRTKSSGIGTNSEFGSPLGSALALSPLLTVYAQDPQATLEAHPTAVKDRKGNVYTIVGPEYNEITNPLAQLSLPGGVGNSDKIVGGFWGELELYKGLKLRSSYNVDLAFWGDDGYRIPYYLGETNKASESSAWSSMNRGHTWLVENTLSYSKKIDLHSFTALLGQSGQSYRSKNIGGSADFLNDITRPSIDGGSPDKKDRSVSGRMSPYHRVASYFGRLSYDFDERYMAEVTMRRDGSSNFGPSNKWGTFPSVSMGWNITNEKFMADRPDFLTYMKLRGSWGKNGNENIEAFRYTTMMQYGNNYILGLDGSTVVHPGAKPNGYPNKDIKWEESEQYDVGLDMYLLNGNITFSVDWFKKKTNGMLMTIPLPEYIGDTRPIGNVGDMENSGFEFDLSYKFKVSDFNFNLNANATYLKNKLLKLGNDTGWANYDGLHLTGTISRAQNGQPFPFFYGYKTDGIFQNWDEVNSYVNEQGQKLQPDAQPGDVRFVDFNKDGVIGDDDRTKIGKGTPDWTMGFNMNVEWKGIDLGAQFYTVLGSDIFDASRRNDLPYINMPEYMLDRWIGEGTSNKMPRLTMENKNSNWRSSDLYVKNGSFLRLRNLQLGYSLPKQWLQKAMISNLRLYVNAENLFTITSYKGFDPEISSGGTSLGIDRGVYPQPRTISIGANLTF